MSRADDISELEELFRNRKVGNLTPFGHRNLHSLLLKHGRDAIAALRFVEEHGETLDCVRMRASNSTDADEALEALRRLTAERGES